MRTPPLALAARRAAGRYLGGETIAQALGTIERLHTEGFAAAIDSFGKAVSDPEQIDETVALYLRINRELAPLRPRQCLGRSLKPRAGHLAGALPAEPGADFETLPQGALLPVRAHDSARTDRVLDLALTLAAAGAPMIPTLQAHLRRSPEGARRLIAANVPVLLVKVATIEPPELALPWGEQTDIAFLELAHQPHTGGARLAIGTPDPVIREALLATLADVDVEILLGVRSEDGGGLLRRGHRVRVYVPFGPDWFRYWMRRLGEARGP